MNNKFKIWHLLSLILLLMLVVRYEFVYQLILLFYYYVKLIGGNYELMAAQLNLTLLDNFASLFIVICAPFVLYLKRKKLKFLFFRANLTNSILTILILSIFLAPIAAPSQFDFQYNISISKLLDPFSTRKIVYLSKDADHKDPVNEFINQRDNVFNKGMTGEYIIADSVKISKGLIIYQKGKESIVSDEKIIGEKISLKVSTVRFLFGTDEFGRDIFSRLIYGARLSLFVGFGSVLISLIIGLLLGFSSGFYGGLADTILNRVSDIFLSFPFIFLIILSVALFGNSIVTIVSILGAAGWMSLFKIIRNETASLKNKDFIVTSKMLGFSDYHILFKEMLPIMMPSIVVSLVLQYGGVIIAESALSYLGLGLGNNFPSWGSMIEAGQYYLSNAWWMSFFPCLFLFLTLYTANNLGSKLESIFRTKAN